MPPPALRAAWTTVLPAALLRSKRKFSSQMAVAALVVWHGVAIIFQSTNRGSPWPTPMDTTYASSTLSRFFYVTRRGINISNTGIHCRCSCRQKVFSHQNDDRSWLSRRRHYHTTTPTRAYPQAKLQGKPFDLRSVRRRWHCSPTRIADGVNFRPLALH